MPFWLPLFLRKIGCLVISPKREKQLLAISPFLQPLQLFTTFRIHPISFWSLALVGISFNASPNICGNIGKPKNIWLYMGVVSYH
jgi:hypothetical protein